MLCQLSFDFDDFAISDSDNENDEWSESEICFLRNYVLVKTVAILEDGRASLRSRTEALEWIQHDGDGPFSFRLCCLNGAEVDPDEFRELVINRLSRKNRKH